MAIGIPDAPMLNRKRKRGARSDTPASPLPPPTISPPSTLPLLRSPPSSHSRTLRAFATKLKRDASQLSLLLDLPPELRNVIYGMICQVVDLKLPRPVIKKGLARSAGKKTPMPTVTKTALACASALPRVNKQVRDEFLSFALLVADICTSTVDFDFRYVSVLIQLQPLAKL